MHHTQTPSNAMNHSPSFSSKLVLAKLRNSQDLAYSRFSLGRTVSGLRTIALTGLPGFSIFSLLPKRLRETGAAAGSAAASALASRSVSCSVAGALGEC